MSNNNYDAIVIGSGPNGLAAAITLAHARLSVLVLESDNLIGGGTRSAALTLPGFTHDVCSSIHPLGIGSPFFSTLPLANYGLDWIQPTVPLAHALDDDTAILLERSIDATSKHLGVDEKVYKKMMEPLVQDWGYLSEDILGPWHIPSHPLVLARFGYLGAQSASGFAQRYFKGMKARALFAGLAAHSMLPLEQIVSASFGLVLGILGHSVGWPLPRGGSQNIANALAAYFRSLGGEILTDQKVTRFDEVANAKVVLFDTSPKEMVKIVGNGFPSSYIARLEKYRYGPGVCKVDFALNHPIPWKDKQCLQAGTVHLGGTLEEIAKSERDVWDDKYPLKSYIILTQPSLFDPSRAPPGKHTAWAYCHVPNGSTLDLTDHIISQIERLAPGFRDCILASSTKTAAQFESYNPNYVGGDINGGAADIYQLFTRPVMRYNPYSTPEKGVYICSASTPPGGGVHGMCGYNAARSALREIFKLDIK